MHATHMSGEIYYKMYQLTFVLKFYFAKRVAIIEA